MSIYKYSPLDESAGQTRLLALLPGEFYAPIRVVIETTYLTTHQTSHIIPRYDALSYTWGAIGETASVQVGEFGDDMLVIPRDLGIALSYLRHVERPRILWIDAICIDQKNPEERGHQVGRMSDIFRLAKQVIAWVGAESVNSAFAMRRLKIMGSHVTVDWNTLEMKPAQNPDCNVVFSDLTVILPYDEIQLRSIWQFLSRSWFERLWVQQEIRLANSSAVIKCGKKTIFWTQFRNAIFCLRTKIRVWDHPDFSQQLERIHRMCELIHGQSIGELLRSTCHFKCSDPRDRIYGLLSLINSSGDELKIQPDYRKTTSQVYSDLVLHIAQQLRHLEILQYCEMHDRAGTISLPSWVPDWTIESQSDTINWGHASGGVFCEAQKVDKDILNVLGVFALKIKLVQETTEDIFSDEGLCWQILRWIDFAHKNHIFRREEVLHTFWRSQFREWWSVPDYPSVKEAQDTFNRLWEHYLHEFNERHSEDFWKKPLPKFPKYRHGRCFQRVRAAFKGRSCLITLGGSIGLGPKAAREGDEICVVLGCSVPLVLRPETSGHRQVVGPAYLKYLMDGSVVLGSFSGNWQRIRRLLPDFGPVIGFKDPHDATGAYVTEDPRLGKVPPSWWRKNHDKDHLYSLFVHKETGEDSEVVGDPRLTPDAIRARGVKLKLFALI